MYKYFLTSNQNSGCHENYTQNLKMQYMINNFIFHYLTSINSQVFIFRVFAVSLKYIHQFIILQNGENFHPQHDVS